MNNTATLFKLPPTKYIPFRDVYHLKGEDKKQELEKMTEFVNYYQGLENPTDQDKRHFLDACTYLEADSLRQQKRMLLSSMMYNKMRQALVTAELEKFKINVKLRFMEKYDTQIKGGTFTPDMSKELDKITRMEKAACYKINGIDIDMKNCDTCTFKACHKKPKPELDEPVVGREEDGQIQ
ncbi:MAG: hypothetical protein PHI79_08215 [Sulfurovaceae bacterium]|jgi:hypothetical protein|nr:hypothetical protein [Sulfurovaceae bacterium]